MPRAWKALTWRGSEVAYLVAWLVAGGLSSSLARGWWLVV